MGRSDTYLAHDAYSATLDEVNILRFLVLLRNQGVLLKDLQFGFAGENEQSGLIHFSYVILTG